MKISFSFALKKFLFKTDFFFFKKNSFLQDKYMIYKNMHVKIHRDLNLSQISPLILLSSKIL